MREQPLVSVVMPVYNGEAFLHEALDSVLLQSYRNLEVLVVDDGSTDRSRQILDEYAAKDARVRVFAQANGGVAKARNVAIEAAQGEFIAPIDADDLWLPQKIERQMAEMMGPGEEAGLVYCWWAWIDEEGVVVDRSPRWRMKGNLLKELVFINFTGNASVPLFRKSSLIEAGMYNPSLAAEQAGGCEDWEVALKVAACHTVRVVPQVLLGYRRRAGSMSSACDTMWRSYRKVMEEIRELAPKLEPALFRASSNQFSMYLAGVSFWAGRPFEAVKWALRSGIRLPLKVSPFVLRMLVMRGRGRKEPVVMRPGRPAREIDMPGPLLPYDRMGVSLLTSLPRLSSLPIVRIWWWWLLVRFRWEASRSTRRKGVSAPRVWAMACWDFPVYSQTFVYRELSALQRAGFNLRFVYSRLGQRRDLPEECADLWQSKQRVLLTDATADWALAYYWRFKPERVRAVVRTLVEASGWTEEEVLQYRNVRQAFAFARLAQAWKAEYIHTYFFYEQAIYGLVASILLDIPRGVSCYADHMLEDYDLKLVAVHLRNCGVIVATSRRIKGELEELAGGSLETAIVKPNGIDSRLYVSAKTSVEESGRVYRIVAVNRIHPKKGMTYLLEAALLLRDRGFQIVLDLLGEVDPQDASSQAYLAQLQAYRLEHGLGTIVRFLGRQTAAEVRTHLSQADLFVAPYVELANGDKDGIPTALLEAMASGCGVVVTHAGSISEVVTDEVDGLVVPQCDSLALAAALERLCGDQSLRTRLREAARERVKTCFDVSVCEGAFHLRIREQIALRDPLRFPVREIPAGKLKLLLLSFEYPPETGFGGIGTYTWHQARALARQGHDVHVLAGAPDTTPLRTKLRDGVLVHRCRSIGVWGVAAIVLRKLRCNWTGQRLENASSMARGLRQLQTKYAFDVLEMPECGAEGFLLPRMAGTLKVVRLHSPAGLIMQTYDVPWMDRFLCRWVEQVGIRKADRLSSCSSFLVCEVRDKLGMTGEIPVIYNGLDLELFDQEPAADLEKAYGIPQGQVTILFAGRMEPRKGVHLIAGIASAVLPGREVTFLLAGDDLFGYVRKTLAPYLEKHGLESRVKVLGKLSMSELRSCAKAVDIYLLPSLWENCPYACLEAMAAGKAVVCSNQGGMPELIEHGVNGLLAETGSATSFATELSRLIDDEELRQSLGRQARVTVEQRFSDDATARQSVAAYAARRENVG